MRDRESVCRLFLFSMFLKDIEEEFIQKGLHGIYVNIFKVFLILHADDIVVFANSSSGLQKKFKLII